MKYDILLYLSPTDCIIPAREHNETLTAHIIKVWTARKRVYEKGVFKVPKMSGYCTHPSQKKVKLLHNSIYIPIWYALQGWNNAVNIPQTDSPPLYHASLSWCCTIFDTWQEDTSGGACSFGQIGYYETVYNSSMKYFIELSFTQLPFIQNEREMFIWKMSG